MRSLLCASRKRPHGRGAAEKRDELAPSDLCAHSITSSAIESSVEGMSIPTAFAVCRLMTNSKLVARIAGSLDRILALEHAAGADAGLEKLIRQA